MSTDFGKDMSCLSGIRTGRYVSGARLVAEAIYRRLTTPRGMLRGGDEEANYGLDLTELVGNASAKSAGAALEGKIRAEVSKDERVNTADVTVTVSTDGPSTTILVEISCETDVGPFDLTLAVDEVTAELIGISTGES